MFGDFITRCLVLLFGYAYPAFECFKSVEKNRIEIEELRFWCQYWIIVALLTVCERIGDIFISWVPMYGELKLAFVIYLWYPKTKGTGYIYETMLRPFVAKHETDIDRKLLEWRARGWDFAIYYWQNCTKLGQSTFFQALEYLAAQSGKLKNGSGERATNGHVEPSAPPEPVTPHDDLPSLIKNGNRSGKWSPKPPGSPVNRELSSDSPKSNRVHVRLNGHTESVQTMEADATHEGDGDVTEKLHQFRMRLRRPKPDQN